MERNKWICLRKENSFKLTVIEDKHLHIQFYKLRFTNDFIQNVTLTELLNTWLVNPRIDWQ